MQGFIINVKKAKNEDIIVTLLTKATRLRLYRFYGARHSVIQLGAKIDFEIENDGVAMPRLRNITPLAFGWFYDIERLRLWQEFLKLLDRHLRTMEEVEPFYFQMLNTLALILKKESPKRAIVERFIDMLDFEGRLHQEERCIFCHQLIKEREYTLTNSFLPAHTFCANDEVYEKRAIVWLFAHKESILLDDFAVERLFEKMLRDFY